MSSLGRAVGKALRKVHSGDEKLAIHRLGGDRLPKLRIESDSFDDGEPIPARHSGSEGENLSPPLRFADIPGGTRELVLIVEDPDAPMPLPFVHWMVYGLPVDAAEIRSGVGERTSLLGAKQGETSMHHQRYDGPAPPRGHGVHHYHFQLFALDSELQLPTGVGRSDLLEAMEGHVIAAGDLVGTYERN